MTGVQTCALPIFNEHVSQNLSGVRVIRAFAQTKKETEKFDKSTNDLANNYLREIGRASCRERV